MKTRKYYSIRHSKDPNAGRMDLPLLLEVFRDMFLRFEGKGYFQMSFGYICVDAGFVPGNLGGNIELHVLRTLHKSNLWPIEDKCRSYSEEDLFDMLEFLLDFVAKPVQGYYHGYNDCGYHYETFDQQTGRDEFRNAVNELLADYKTGFEVSKDGEILASAEEGLANLFQADLKTSDPKNIENRVQAAVLKFRRYRSSLNDRRDAIRDLSDVLEFLRPKVKKVLTSKDEDDLFNIANNFSIRHHNPKQKTDYDTAIWYSWMFYFYLATIHAFLRLLQRQEQAK